MLVHRRISSLLAKLFYMPWLGILSVMFAQSPCAAQFVETRDQLPKGYYIYLGPSPGNYPRQKFSIEEQGKVIFHGTVQKKLKPAVQEKPPEPEIEKEKAKQDAEAPWEENRGGVIKWKGHPITNIPDGVAQLETDFTLGPGYSPDGFLRFKLRLFKIPVVPEHVQVRLLDKNGFKLMDFSIKGYQFLPVPETALVEANEQISCHSSIYKKLRDYSVAGW